MSSSLATGRLRKALVRGAASLLAVLGAGAIYVACSSCCIRSGSMILTPDGPVAIESLRPGDTVLSWDFQQGRLVPNKVSKTYRKLGFRWVKAALPDGQVLEATLDHRAYDVDYGGYARVGEVKRFALLDGQGAALAAQAPASSEVTYGVATFHDLSLTGEPRNYVANGVVVHNKSPVLGPYSGTGSPYTGTGSPYAGSGSPYTGATSPYAGSSGGPISDVMLPTGTGTPPSPIGGVAGPPAATVSAGTGGGTTTVSTGTNDPTATLTLGLPIPSSGSQTGGDLVYLKGNGVATGMTVTIAGQPANVVDLDLVNGTILVSTPSLGTAPITPVDIFIRRPDGATLTLPSSFTYQPFDQHQFKFGTDKWMVLFDADLDANNMEDFAEALASAIGPSGAAGDFTGMRDIAIGQVLSFTEQFYGNQATGRRNLTGIPISFMSSTFDGGRVLTLATFALNATLGNFATPLSPINYNVMAFRKTSVSGSAVGRAIADGPDANPNVENNSGSFNGMELGVLTNSVVGFWNAAAISNSQRLLIELTEEYASVLAHEVGHSIGRVHTDATPPPPATVNIMSATAAFDIANVYAFDTTSYTMMLSYMPGPNRMMHALSFSPRYLLDGSDAVVLATGASLADGVLDVDVHAVVQGDVTPVNGRLEIQGFDPQASADAATLADYGRTLFFLQRTDGGWRLDDGHQAIGVGAQEAEWLQVVADYQALAQLSGQARLDAYAARLVKSLGSSEPYLRRTAFLELAYADEVCDALTPAQLEPVLAALADPQAPIQERILAGQALVHRGDASLAGEVLQTALGADDPKLLKTLAGALETSLGLQAAAARVREALAAITPEQAPRARVLLGWLQDASSVTFISQGLADDAQAGQAADALARVGSQDALPALEALALDASRPFLARESALRAIGIIGGEQAESWLRARYDAAPAGDLRDALETALASPETWLVR